MEVAIAAQEDNVVVQVEAIQFAFIVGQVVGLRHWCEQAQNKVSGDGTFVLEFRVVPATVLVLVLEDARFQRCRVALPATDVRCVPQVCCVR